MDLLAYWRYDNYLRDLDEGAGFHFNSKQSRLHTAINSGESVWLFTRIVTGGMSQYRLLARLVVCAKTINAPGYQYGPYRVWGNVELSSYFKVTHDSRDDIFELLRLLEFDGTSLAGKDRTTIAHACQTIRALPQSASGLLVAKAETLQLETRARMVVDEEKLEKTLHTADEHQLQLLLRDEGAGYADEAKMRISGSYERNRQLVSQLYALYGGRCQVTGHDSPLLYGVPTAEAHHIVYRSRGGEDCLDNLVLVSPNLHRAIHGSDAKFDNSNLSFIFPNGRVEPLILNQHLAKRVA